MIDTLWLDRFGLVRPRKAMADSGNGITYSVLYLLLTQRLKGIDQTDESLLRIAIFRCKIKTGLYGRNPENSYGNEAWDDYLALFAIAILFESSWFAKGIFWYGVRHAGFFNTNNDLQWSDFLWRSFHVFFGLSIVASYPKTITLMKPLLWFFSLFLNSSDGTNGVFLDWIWFQSLSNAGYTHKKLADLDKRLFASVFNEMDPAHPCCIMALKLKGSNV